MRFPGQIRLPDIDHPAIPATFVVDDAQAEIFLDEESLGRWSLYDVHARRLVSSAFEVDLGDEEIVFLADDPIDFAYQGVEHMAKAWARFKAMRLPRRMISVSMSRRDTAPSRIGELRTLMEENLRVTESQAGEPAEELGAAPVPSARWTPPPPAPAPDAPLTEDAGLAPAPPSDTEQLERQRLELEAARSKLEEERRRLEEERLEALRHEEERREAIAEEMEALEQKRRDAERLLELERAEAARLEKAAEEAARLEEERRRLEETRAEVDRAEEERKEELRAEVERLEAERLEAVRAEEERQSEIRAEMERLEVERLQTLREEEERKEELRAEMDRLEAEREEAARAEEERQSQIRAEEERLRDLREQTEARLEAERVTVELAAEPVEQEPERMGEAPERAVAEPDLWDLEPEPDLEPAGARQPEPAMAGAARERSGLMGAVKSAFARGGRTHEHVFVEAAGGLGIVRYVCEECGHVSISVSD
ncbi:MAG: hypothetical protein KY394_00695 [Actinobacteria bacterium]|nr:hypothetical protein [Actinomycetota bacterium]